MTNKFLNKSLSEIESAVNTKKKHHITLTRPVNKLYKKTKKANEEHDVHILYTVVVGAQRAVGKIKAVG